MKTKLNVLTDLRAEAIPCTLISKNETYIMIQTMNGKMMIPWIHVKQISED